MLVAWLSLDFKPLRFFCMLLKTFRKIGALVLS